MAPRRDTRALHRLGTTVRMLREERGLSQEALAQEAGIHVNHVSSIERGAANPSVLVLLAIARAVRKSLSVVVDGV